MRPYVTPGLAGVAALVLLTGAAVAQTAPASPPAPAAAPAAPAAPALRFYRYNATELEIRDTVAFVRVHPENRADIAVSIVNPSSLPAPQLRTSRNRLLVIDGQLRRRVRGCHTGAQGRFDVNVSNVGWLRTEQIPIIEVRVPQNAQVSAGGAVRLTMGRAETADVTLDGCGDADLEGVAGDVNLAIAGSSDVRLYDAGMASISLAGDGDATVGVIRNGLTVSIAGSGDLTASRVDGPTNIAVQGSGNVTIRDGHAGVLSVAIAGEGDVIHNGVADRLDAAILGSGDVRVRRVTGQVTRRVLGGGDIVVSSR